MSMPLVKLHVQAIPKTLVRVGVAGDFLKNLSLGTLSDREIQNIQQAVAEGLIARLVVTGIDARGLPMDRFWMRFDPLVEDTKVMLDMAGGKSTLEAVDVGLAGGVAAAVEILKRKNLRPNVTFEWSASAKANPARLADAQQRLGFVDVPPLAPLAPSPPPAPTAWPTPTPSPYAVPPTSYQPTGNPAPPSGYVFKEVLTITPAKDTGIHYGMDTLRKAT